MPKYQQRFWLYHCSNHQVNPVAPIYAGQLQNGVIWIRVEGKGSFKNSTELKAYVSLVIKEGAKEFVIDLENIPVCCEVNTIPKNEVSLNFHHKNGFIEVGEHQFDDHSVVYLKR